MTDIALAWTLSDSQPPPPCQIWEAGPVRVIGAPAASCSTPRLRLGLLQSCFEAGIDVAALGLERAWPLAAALQQAATCHDDLRDQLNCLQGAGQLTLHLTWDQEQPLPGITTGRGWLTARHHRQARADLAAAALLDLASLNCVMQGPIHRAACTCSIDLLVARSDFDRVKARIAQAGCDPRWTGLPAPSLTVTGLWPPVAFARRPLAAGFRA